MASKSETGHAKNLATFKKLVNYAQEYGSNYNPSSTQIKIDNLQIQLAAAETAHANCIKKQTTFNHATHIRMKLFAELGFKATRMMNALIASGAEENTIKSARSIMNKLQGKRAAKPQDNPDPTQPQAENNSVSQRSYDKQLDHYNAFLELLQTSSTYQPNETELQTTTLLSYQAELQDANNQVTQTYTEWSNTRIIRYNLLYAKTTGFADTAQLIKTYIKSIYGATSPQYKQLTALQFSQSVG